MWENTNSKNRGQRKCREEDEPHSSRGGDEVKEAAKAAREVEETREKEKRRVNRYPSNSHRINLMGINAPRKILQPEPNPSGPGQAGQTKVRSSHINTG